MQHLADSKQISDKILNLVANSSNFSTLVKDLTTTIGTSFQVDACIVISAQKECLQNSLVSYWKKPEFPTIDSQTLFQCCNKILKQKPQQIAIKENLFCDIFTEPVSSLTVTKLRGNNNDAVVLLKSASDSWHHSEKQLLENMSEAIAIAFSQLQLQHKIETQAGYQHLLSRLSKAIAKSSDTKILFNLALAEIGKALSIDRAQILTIKYKDPYFVQRKRQQSIKANLTVTESWSAIENDGSLPEKFTFTLADSSCCQRALDIAPQPLVIDRDANFPDLAADLIPPKMKFTSSAALLIMPLMGKATSEAQPPLVLGFLVLQRGWTLPEEQTDCSYTWSIEEINTLDWIRVQLSTALIHQQTLTQVQSMVEERTSQLQWSVDVQAKLSEKMRQQIEQLKKLNELKDDFLSSMSHELKTPMTSMKMAIKMLRQDIPETMRVRYLDILEQEWNREYNLIKDLLTLQQVESGELTFDPQELQLKPIMENLSAAFNDRWHSAKGLVLETTFSEDNLQLYSDLESLQNILNELLLNAGKYSDADTKVNLSVVTRKNSKGKEIEIAVDNCGAEITPHELPYIFDKFRRGKGVTDRAVPGTGLGLTLVKHLVEHLNGKIDVTSEAVANSDLFKTTFTITLPQHK